jgi:hypothetical protein
MENSTEAPPKAKNKTIIQFTNTTPGHKPKGM